VRRGCNRELVACTFSSRGKWSVKLDGRGVAVTKIRSSGIGVSTITARSLPLKNGETQITFDPPWAFAVAAILGGAIGVLARRAKPGVGKSRSVLGNLIAGIALGLLGAVAYAVGVNLTGYVPQAKVGEALVFFVAGIISYAGGISKTKE
jgi:hypothetical protein